MKYVVIYDIRLKGSRALIEDNSLIVRDIDSLVMIKESIMYLHAVDPNLHYVRILNICPLPHTREREDNEGFTQILQKLTDLDLTIQDSIVSIDTES